MHVLWHGISIVYQFSLSSLQWATLPYVVGKVWTLTNRTFFDSLPQDKHNERIGFSGAKNEEFCPIQVNYIPFTYRRTTGKEEKYWIPREMLQEERLSCIFAMWWLTCYLSIAYILLMKHLSQVWKSIKTPQKHSKKISCRKQTRPHYASNSHWNSAHGAYRNAEFGRKSNNTFIFISLTGKRHTRTDYVFCVYLFYLPHSTEELKLRSRINTNMKVW